MLDIKFIREHADIVKDAIRKKHMDLSLDELLVCDEERLELLKKIETLRAEQNEASTTIAQALPDARPRLIEEMQSVKASLKALEDRMAEVMKTWHTLMLRVPNVPDISVPEGVSDADNLEIREWGDKPSFTFEPRDHITLAELLGLADFDRGSKVAGFRGYYLVGDGALLSFALWQFAMNYLAGQGFTPMIVPSLVTKKTLYGTGYLPLGEEDLYRTQDEEYLSGTGEVATMAYHMDEILDVTELPKKIAAFSPCFRREAGSHGKDTKGLMRVHEFFKLEQVVLCEASHQTSVTFHEEINRHMEAIIQALGIPYRVVVNCGGDLGLGQVKKYDIELWIPSQKTYREISSASYFHDFQTRRLNIRYRDQAGVLRYVHSLNSTATPTPRLLIALLEHYQQADGSIRIPEVLLPYMHGKTFLTKDSPTVHDHIPA